MPAPRARAINQASQLKQKALKTCLTTTTPTIQFRRLPLAHLRP